ncbi:replication endonuclease [Iodobacter sp.]|uniref:replication endonuclease n=1 Tax=Iodobacter sp. TaxID=1915058 RepID=UPI0025ED337D|nr:replication endonuclease [Iodobacter sp.]
MASSSDFFHPEKVQQRQAASKAAFVDGVLQKVHSSLHPYLRNKWQELHDTVNEPAANLWLRQFRDSLSSIPFSPDLAADDAELKALAKKRANEMKEIYARNRLGFAGGEISVSAAQGDMKFLAGICGVNEDEKLFIRLNPVGQNSEEVAAEKTIKYALDKYLAPVDSEALEGAILRLMDSAWWIRKLRVHQKQALEHERIKFGFVGKSQSPYVSYDELIRFVAQRTKSKNTLENIIVVNDLGEEFTLADFVALSVSNPEIRMAELMTRIAGIESIAQELGHCGLFITVTCPSKFHAQKLDYSGTHSIRNDKYQEYTPKQANEYLCNVWGLLRTALSDHGIKLYGIRVAEPHHNGCPHWHMLMFVEPKYRATVVRLFRRYFQAMDKDEPMAWKYRFNVKDIDWKRGSAAGYLIKYLCKNIDGTGMIDAQGFLAADFDSDLDVIHAAERVNAWASCWGIRQFQFIGTPPVGIWRELRRIDGEVSEEFTAAADAADRGDWAEFTRIMQVDRKVLLKKDNGLNKYREPTEKIKGLIDVATGDSIITREREWELIFVGGSVFDFPRTSDNNYRNDQPIEFNKKKTESEVGRTHKLAVANILEFDQTSLKRRSRLKPTINSINQQMAGVT